MLTTDGLTFSTARMTVREYSSSSASSSGRDPGGVPETAWPVDPAPSSDTRENLLRMELLQTRNNSRCGDPAQGFGFRLHLSNVLNITIRTSLPPPDRPGSDDSMARPYRTFIRVLQGPENSRASPAPTARTYPGPKSSTLWIQPACRPVSTRRTSRTVKAYE